MSNSHYWKLPFLTILKQLAATYVLATPVLIYFAGTAMSFAKSNAQLCLGSSLLASLIGVLVIIGVNSLAMRRMRRFTEPVGSDGLRAGGPWSGRPDAADRRRVGGPVLPHRNK